MTSTFLGRVDYATALEIQEHMVSRLAHVASAGVSGSQNQILPGHIYGLEHPSVITLGKRSKPLLDLRTSPEELRATGIEVIQSARGGEATLHCPGQLVIYPCVSLVSLRLGARSYVEKLQSCTQRFFSRLGIETRQRHCEPGLYTKTGKIAFFGIRISRKIAHHGLAINVCNDLSLFTKIRSCGIQDEKFDKIETHLPKKVESSQADDLDWLFRRWVKEFAIEFLGAKPDEYSHY